MNRSGAFCGALALVAVGCGDSPASPTPGNQGSWVTLAPMPAVRQELASAVLNGRLFAFGGVSNRAFAYNPGANSWSEVASMNFEHGNTAAVAVMNNRIYVAGERAVRSGKSKRTTRSETPGRCSRR